MGCSSNMWTRQSRADWRESLSGARICGARLHAMRVEAAAIADAKWGDARAQADHGSLAMA